MVFGQHNGEFVTQGDGASLKLTQAARSLADLQDLPNGVDKEVALAETVGAHQIFVTRGLPASTGFHGG